jgi:hypothetical protein
MGVNILIAGSEKGKGVVVNNKSKNETFMKMLELRAGLGFGAKKFRVVFVFDNEKAFNGFANSGWEFGGQSKAAAKTGDKGGAMRIGELPSCSPRATPQGSFGFPPVTCHQLRACRPLSERSTIGCLHIEEGTGHGHR